MDEAGRSLVEALEALGITEFDDSHIVEPCSHPHCTEHSRDTVLSMGNYRAATVRTVAEKLRRLAIDLAATR
ncbi:hypothetical protein CP970_19455 [Streptomyces kanamyceticus]|uniref:Uncharacterized protein n=1 Tax=Streptomyces kanamyceticus TaxID=1967 RepID=A0A5J6GFY4_STRKN|nr:hypothetical protein CP970_19455 [Streptomyces kanamyceticus]